MPFGKLSISYHWNRKEHFLTTLSMDFETRSTIDLRKAGVYAYAEHHTTDVWCLAYAFDDGDVQLWVPGDEPPERIVAHVQAGGELRAWNAQFERVIWCVIMVPRYGFPKPAQEQWFCTAAEAAAMALPRALGVAARVLNMPERKDDDVRGLMMRMSRPRSTKGGIVWWTDEGRRHHLYEYCKQDVRAERAIAGRIRRLTKHERLVYLLDQRINDRGMMLDLPLINGAQGIVNIGLERANADIKRITGGAVEKVTQVADLTRWLQYKGLGIDNIRKSTVRDMLLEDGVGGEVRQVLEIRADAGRSSVAKLKSMRAAKCKDDRVRGLLFYHGASTGRWSGKLVQPHNMPRGEVDNVEQYVPAMIKRDFDTINKEHPPLVVVSSLLRGMLRATPGSRLLCADFSAIEARVLAWIAMQDDLVAAFAAGAKIYEEMASRIYKVPAEEVAKDSRERQVSKNTVLGCGFGMGAATFVEQLHKQTGIVIDEEEGQLNVDTYRALYPLIPKFWRDINSAAIRAVAEPGLVTHCGRNGAIRYVVRNHFLWCVLPSGRSIAYCLPQVVSRKTPWKELRAAVRYMGTNAYTKKWGPLHLYGGLLAENVVQAIARDLMAASMLRVERKGYPVVLSVHDEILADVPNEFGSLAEFCDLMARKPRWADGCPVSVEGWEGARYKK